MYDPNDNPLVTTKPEQNKFTDLQKLVNERYFISSTNVDLLMAKLYEVTRLQESIKATESLDMPPDKESLMHQADNIIRLIIKRLRALASPAGLGLDDGTVSDFKERFFDTANNFPYLAVMHPEIMAIASVVIGPVLLLELLARVASNIKTPLFGNRGSRGGEGGQGECFNKINVEAARQWLASNLLKPGQSPHDHLPEVMAKAKDEILAIYAAAFAANEAAKESYGYAQAATRDRLLAGREYRESVEQRMHELFPALREIREELKLEWAKQEAEREDALNKAEKNDPTQPKNKLPPDAPLVPTACPPRLDAEYIDPVSYWRELRNSPQLKEPPKYRFAGPFTAMTPGAMAFMLAAESAAAGPAAGAPQGGAKVIIERILPPPTHLADEDFRRCMQREIDKLIIDFDTGVRG